MHHKRGRPRSARVGCKMCEFWKINDYRTERREGETYGDHRRRAVARESAAGLVFFLDPRMNH